MDLEKFRSLSYVPLPVLQGDKYAPFDQLYGKPPDEKDCPSLQKSVAAQTDSSRRELLVSTKVRKAITCDECTKPRCVYSRSKLCRAEEVAIENVKDSHLYTCGSSIFLPDSKYYDSIVWGAVCVKIYVFPLVSYNEFYNYTKHSIQLYNAFYNI